KHAQSIPSRLTTNASRIRTNPPRRISRLSTTQRNTSRHPPTALVRIKVMAAVRISNAATAVVTAAAIVAAADVGGAEAAAAVADVPMIPAEEIFLHRNMPLRKEATAKIAEITISAIIVEDTIDVVPGVTSTTIAPKADAMASRALLRALLN